MARSEKKPDPVISVVQAGKKAQSEGSRPGPEKARSSNRWSNPMGNLHKMIVNYGTSQEINQRASSALGCKSAQNEIRDDPFRILRSF